ncbi:MAG TPA: NAD(P)H-dependent oxidoreductase [Lysobacter sp.]
MYNFSVPTQLKSWLDAIAVPGKTFSYGPDGAKGLLGEKRVIVTSWPRATSSTGQGSSTR